LPFLDGQYSSVNSIHLYKDASNYNGGDNRTNRFLQDPNDISSLDERSVRLEARAPISYGSRTCAKYAQYGDYGISYDAQRNIDAKFCNFLAGVTPSFWALVGLKVSNLACGNFVCQGVWTVSSAVAGQYISKAISTYCSDQFAALDKACGTIGGQQTDTVKGNKVIVEAFATTEKGTECESRNYKGGNRCATFECKNKDCSNRS
jgi:hypothetical protein